MNNSKILTGQSYSTLFSTLIHVRPNMRHKIQTEIVASHTSKSTESPLQPKNIFQITTFFMRKVSNATNFKSVTRKINGKAHNKTTHE